MSASPRRAGVLGGMGPEATLTFLGRFYALTRAQREQDRPVLFLDMNPAVPDRNVAWRSGSTAPAAAIADMGRRLARAGAAFCVMPCITAHGYTANFEESAGIPLLRLPEVVADSLGSNAEVGKVGLLATTTTVEMRLFHTAFASVGTDLLCPSQDDQVRLMKAIYDIKRGGDARHSVAAVAEQLVGSGAQTLLVGCTDLSLLGLTEVSGRPVVDAVDLLAQRTLVETS